MLKTMLWSAAIEGTCILRRTSLPSATRSRRLPTLLARADEVIE
jgi:hypothetical protein